MNTCKIIRIFFTGVLVLGVGGLGDCNSLNLTLAELYIARMLKENSHVIATGNMNIGRHVPKGKKCKQPDILR